jgi:hypothetical protein
LKKGQAAPFPGNLLTDAALAKLVTDAQAREARMQVAITRCGKERAAERGVAKAVCRARVAEWQAKEAACRDAAQARSKIFTSALQKCGAQPPWYQRPMFSFILGTVISGGICSTAAALGSR